jgi:hypothetical protein
VVTSDTSTLPPAFIHAVRVGVPVIRLGVGRLVGRIVGVIGLVDVIWVVSLSDGTVNSWFDMEVEGIVGCGIGTGLQAVKKIKTMHAITRLLNTLAVYHKNHPGCLILSPCEYVHAYLLNHSFAGKIAGYLIWRN